MVDPLVPGRRHVESWRAGVELMEHLAHLLHYGRGVSRFSHGRVEVIATDTPRGHFLSQV